MVAATLLCITLDSPKIYERTIGKVVSTVMGAPNYTVPLSSKSKYEVRVPVKETDLMVMPPMEQSGKRGEFQEFGAAVHY